jgi:DNA polymerase-3 subunit alpha
VSMTGKIRKQETNDGTVTVSLSAEKIEVLDVAAAQAAGAQPVTLSIREERITPPLTEELKRILLAHPGRTPVHLNITRPGAVKPLRVNLTKFTIDPTGSFMGDIKSLLGSAAVEV